MTVLLNQGLGTFAAARHYAPGARPNAIAASDLDGDGDNDLAIANFGSGSEQTELQRRKPRLFDLCQYTA